MVLAREVEGGDWGVFPEVGHVARDVGVPDLGCHDLREPVHEIGVGEVDDASLEAGTAGDDGCAVGRGVLHEEAPSIGFGVEVTVEAGRLGGDVGQEGVM